MWRKIKSRLSQKSVRRRKLKSAKSVLFWIILGLLLALGIYSRTEAATFTFPNVSAEPNATKLLFPVGERVTLLRTGATTNGKYTMAKFVIPPGGGPPPHIHHREDEWFYVVEGNLQMQMGFNQYPDPKVIPGNGAPKENYHSINAPAGTLMYTSRYHLHSFKNLSNKPVTMLTVWAPSGIENYFKAAAQPLPDPSNPPPLNPKNKELFVSLAPKYGISQSSSFDQYVGKVDNNIPAPKMKDNRADELRKLLAPQVRP